MDRHGAGRIIRRVAHHAGLAKKISPHTLLHRREASRWRWSGDPHILFFHVDNRGFGELVTAVGRFEGGRQPRRWARRGWVPADQLLPGVAVHADAVGVVDGAARDSFGHA
jgi:hypothetical protein